MTPDQKAVLFDMLNEHGCGLLTIDEMDYVLDIAKSLTQERRWRDSMYRRYEDHAQDALVYLRKVVGSRE